MRYTRQTREQLEAQSLAPYALKSGASRGRQYPEAEAPLRTAFQRDRERILHTTAFRRLEYKTQVFVNYEGDHYRTRLTHTLEVAQIGRSLAAALGANQDLVEAICLGHDLGHPPFGHAGEAVLDRLMAQHGGFEHNQQTYRILTQLEKRYPDWDGLNLTYETLEGLVKHETKTDFAARLGFAPHLRASLEAQLANIADDIAYNAHDLDDGLRAGLLQPAMLRGLDLWERVCEQVGWQADKPLTDLTRHRLLGTLVNLLATDVIEYTAQALESQSIHTPEAVQSAPTNLVSHSPDIQAAIGPWRAFLYAEMYHHHRVIRMAQKAERFLTELFQAFVHEPRQLPASTQAKLAKVGLERGVTDYLAGMTDRYALQEWERLFSPFVRP